MSQISYVDRADAIANATNLANATLLSTLRVLTADGLLSKEDAEAWASCHAVVVAEAPWARFLHPKLRSWFGLNEDSLQPTVVKICEAEAPRASLEVKL